MTLLAGPALAGPEHEAELLSRVNALRAANGLAPLIPDERLSAVARTWAQHLADSGNLSHNGALASQAPAGWSSIGENVGYGTTVQEIQESFVADPPHLANLLSPGFDSVGLGVVEAGGTLWAVQDFMGTGGPEVAQWADPTALPEASGEEALPDPAGAEPVDETAADDDPVGDGRGRVSAEELEDD